MIINDIKTQTCRVVKAGERLDHDLQSDGYVLETVYSASGRVKWQTNRTYAVQAGRGKPSVARIQIETIWEDNLQEISPRHVLREGGYTPSEFATLWDTINKTTGTRWRDNPAVWVIHFTLHSAS